MARWTRTRWTRLAPVLGLSVLGGCGLPPEHSDGPEVLGTQTSALGLLGTYGGIKAYTHVPAGMPASAGLVVALHGCLQYASDYAKAGWNEVANTHRFYVLYPEKPYGGCFNWYDSSSTKRGAGEVATLKSMVDAMKAQYSIDPRRIFVTGLSAGGGMATALLAAYPDIFAGGATFAGLPAGCSSSCQFGTNDTPQAWATVARSRYPGYAGPWPRLSVWQGANDLTVSPTNLNELMEQWTQLLGVDQVADTSTTVSGITHRQYKDASGQVQVETRLLTTMGHGVPIQAGVCGTTAAYMLNIGLCSSLEAAAFFGLTAPLPLHPWLARGPMSPELEAKATRARGGRSVLIRKP